MTKAQSKRLAEVFAELHDPASHLHFKIVSDLRNGSVLIGKTKRSNPPVPESALEDALSEVYVCLCKMPYPWIMSWNNTGDKTFQDEATANIIVCKLATLEVLTYRRIRANRLVIDADLNHHLITEGNAPVTSTETMNGESPQEYLDYFTQDDRLNVHSTQLIPKDPTRKTFADYRKITPIRAKCHPQKGHFAKQWCADCYSAIGRRFEVIPVYTPALAKMVLAMKRVFKPAPSPVISTILLNRIANTRGVAPPWCPPKPPDTYAGLGFWNAETVEEWMRTALQTMPINGNQFQHATFIRDLNRLHQRGCNLLWERQITKHNQNVLARISDE